MANAMKWRIYLAIIFSLMIISSLPISSSTRAFYTKAIDKTGLTPPTNSVIFLYYNGGSPVYTKAQLGTFFNDVLGAFAIKEITSLDTYKELENASVLMLLGQTDLSSIKMDVLEQFIVEGGSLLIALPPDNFSAFDSVLELFSLRTYGKILDNSSYYNNQTNVVVNDSFMIREHPSIRSIFGNVSEIVIPNGAGIERLDSPPLINATFEDYSLVWGLNSTFVDKNDNGVQDEDEPYGENISLIHVVETWFGGKIVVLPSIEMIIDDYILDPQFDNLILSRALTYWFGNQIGFISIRNIVATPTFLDITHEKLEINVSAIVTDENNNTLSQVQVNACLVRLGRVISQAEANRLNNKPIYLAILNVSKVKPGAAYIYVMAYKKYFGYFWVRGPRITLYKPPVTIGDIHPLVLVFGAIVPILSAVILSVYLFPEYRNKRKRLREIEGKIIEK